MDIRQTNCPKIHKGHLGVLRGSNIQKSREAINRLDRLAPTLVHVGGFIWEYKYKLSLNTPWGHGGGGGSQIQKCWTDWHQLSSTSVDSSGNGHRLKTIRPTIPRATFWVVLWDQQFKILGNVVKRLDRLGINCAHAKCRRIWERTQVEQIGPKDTKGSILTWG